MEPTDRDLMLAVRNGDGEKFGLLFDRYHQSLFSFFYRLSGDAASSEEIDRFNKHRAETLQPHDGETIADPLRAGRPDAQLEETERMVKLRLTPEG